MKTNPNQSPQPRRRPARRAPRTPTLDELRLAAAQETGRPYIDYDEMIERAELDLAIARALATLAELIRYAHGKP